MIHRQSIRSALFDRCLDGRVEFFKLFPSISHETYLGSFLPESTRVLHRAFKYEKRRLQKSSVIHNLFELFRWTCQLTESERFHQKIVGVKLEY